MGKSIRACSVDEWFEQFKKTDESISGARPFYAANIFFAQQYFGLEISEKATREAYCIESDGKARAWLLCYPLSDEVIRLRGIYCDEKYRRQGFSKQLMSAVCSLKGDRYKSALLFVPESKIPFYSSCGFVVSREFTPRKVEYYNSTTQSYDLDVGEVFCVMKKDL